MQRKLQMCTHLYTMGLARWVIWTGPRVAPGCLHGTHPNRHTCLVLWGCYRAIPSLESLDPKGTCFGLAFALEWSRSATLGIWILEQATGGLSLFKWPSNIRMATSKLEHTVRVVFACPRALLPRALHIHPGTECSFGGCLATANECDMQNCCWVEAALELIGRGELCSLDVLQNNVVLGKMKTLSHSEAICQV